jgi:hypothetical protein
MTDTTKAAVDALMSDAQVFASAWSLVGSRFDEGDCLSEAEARKAELRTAIQSAIERARADGLEQAAKWVDARRDTYMLEHGTFDPFTGQLEFGRGVMGEIKIEHIGELSGISEGIRALDTSPKTPEGGQS